jgi:hypothetical protein
MKVLNPFYTKRRIYINTDPQKYVASHHRWLESEHFWDWNIEKYMDKNWTPSLATVSEMLAGFFHANCVTTADIHNLKTPTLKFSPTLFRPLHCCMLYHIQVWRERLKRHVQTSRSVVLSNNSVLTSPGWMHVTLIPNSTNSWRIVWDMPSIKYLVPQYTARPGNPCQWMLPINFI